MLLPGREWQEGYRFGFQKQEYEKEMGEGISYFKFRIESSMLGRFLSIDPLSREYSYNSPYAFSENKPLAFIELEGAEVFFAPDGVFLGKIGNADNVVVINQEIIDQKGGAMGVAENLNEIQNGISSNYEPSFAHQQWYISNSIDLGLTTSFIAENALLDVISCAEHHNMERTPYDERVTLNSDGSWPEASDIETVFGAYQFSPSTFINYRKKYNLTDMTVTPANQDETAILVIEDFKNGQAFNLMGSADIFDPATQKVTLQQIYDILGTDSNPNDTKNQSQWPSLPGQSQNGSSYKLDENEAQQVFNNNVKETISLAYDEIKSGSE